MFDRRFVQLGRGRTDSSSRLIWPPTKVAGLTAWLDMLEPSTYTVTGGTTVTSITNIVSGTAWTEGVNPPGYSATEISSRPGMTFNASTRRIISTEATVVACFAGTDKANTVIMVAKPTTSTVAFKATFGFANSGAPANGSGLRGRHSNGNWRTEHTTDAGVNKTATRSTSTTLTPQVVAFLYDGINATTYVDQEAVPSPLRTATPSGTVTPNRVALGCTPGSALGSFSDDSLGCLLVFDRMLTVDRVRGLMGALKARWAL